MTTMTHYEDEAIIALLERGAVEVHADAHVSACAACRSKIDEYGDIAGALREEIVWKAAPPAAEPSERTISFLRGFVQSARNEDAVAGPLVEELLAGTREEWMPRLVADPKYRTAGVVRKLVLKAEEVSGTWPADELAITELATEIAEYLNPEAYAVGTVGRLRGDAWRARAYALEYTGDHHAAMAAITRAKQQYDSLPIADYDLARLELTRALILRQFNRTAEGLESVRLSQSALAASGDTTRLRLSRWIEAAMRARAQDYRRALNIYLELERDIPADDRASHARLLQNISMAYRELGENERALEYARHALTDFQELHLPTGELARVRWSVGELLLKLQRYGEAEPLLKDLGELFEERQMRTDSTMVRLELAEVFIVEGRFDEAIAMCEAVMNDLRALGLEASEGALTAVTYLQEATRSRNATATLARHVQDFVRETKTQPALLFAPPPLG